MMEPLVFSLPKHPFDYQYLSDQLKGYRSPRAKIGSMLKKREIVRIKKGLYVLPERYGGRADKMLLSNLVYGPSYVSLEYALSYWGLIPEKVEVVTAVTNKRNKQFRTPMGVFTYRYLNNRIFHLGRMLLNEHDSTSIIASKEKCLCDKLATVKGIKTEDDLVAYLDVDLRLDREEIKGLDKHVLNAIAAAYNNRSVFRFRDWYLKWSVISSRTD